MNISLMLYLGTAAFTAAYVFYHGVVLSRRTRFITFAEQVVLSMVCLGVGALWVLFVPGLLIHALRDLRRIFERNVSSLPISGTKAARARG